jgi:hypothetical protein
MQGIRSTLSPEEDMFHVMQTGGADRFVKIRRSHRLSDSLDTMSRMPTIKLKKQIRISFIDEYGSTEAGIDAGGLFKDFIERLIKVRSSCFCTSILYKLV